MSRRPWMLLLACALLALPPLQAQEPPALATVFTVHTQLGQAQAYEAALQELWKAFRKAGLKRPISVMSGISDPGDYTFVVGFSKWADLDEQGLKEQAAFASVPSVGNSLTSVATSSDWSIWRSRPDLSYVPTSPRLPEAEQLFTRVAFVRPHFAKAQAYEAVLQEAVALRRKHGLGDAVGAWQLWGGADGPAFALVTTAKDEADFHTQNAAALAKMGAEWQAYLAKAGPMLRDVSYITGRSRPDLAFAP